MMNTLIELKNRNIKGRIVASKYLNFTQPLDASFMLGSSWIDAQAYGGQEFEF